MCSKRVVSIGLEVRNTSFPAAFMLTRSVSPLLWARPVFILILVGTLCTRGSTSLQTDPDASSTVTVLPSHFTDE